MPTATRPIDLRAVQQLLDHLKSRIAGIAAAEAATLKSKAERLTALRRDAQRHAEADQGLLDARIEAIGSAYRAGVAIDRVAMEARLAKIHQIYHDSRASLARRIEEKKDRRIGKVQGSIMRQRQLRQQELEQAVERQRAFQEHLAAARATRRDLRKSAMTRLRMFQPWIDSWFDEKQSQVDPDVELESAEVARDLIDKFLVAAAAALDAAARRPWVVVFRYLPVTVVALAIVIINVAMGAKTAGASGIMAQAPAMLLGEMVLGVCWGIAWMASRKAIRVIADLLGVCRGLEIAADEMVAAQVASLGGEIRQEQDEQSRTLGDTFRESGEAWRDELAAGQRKLDNQFARLPAMVERLDQRKVARREAAYQAALNAARDEAERRSQSFEAGQKIIRAAVESESEKVLAEQQQLWDREVLPAIGELLALAENAWHLYPAWTHELCVAWEAPLDAPQAVRIGQRKVDLEVLSNGLPRDPRFALPSGKQVQVPFGLGFPDHASLMLETEGIDEAALPDMQAMVLRLLASHPVGRATFLFIDPVGLGKDFAGLMHLADYEETLINQRIWTQSHHIEERLAEVNDHIEKVIQMYLRDEYSDLASYNQQAGTIAEKYRYLVIAGFPAGFSDTACKRLRSIAASGARCGVHLLIQTDLRQPSPDPALTETLHAVCLRLRRQGEAWQWQGAIPGSGLVMLDAPPAAADATRLVHRIGRASIDSNRVEVPFSQIAPSAAEIWQASTHDELRVPIGRTGAKKLQWLAIGKGTRQHLLVAGKTGSGKSTLFHVIVTNLALWCSPEQVEFYLVDFKKGVEFKCYAKRHLPHARVIAIESDREFALSVLQRVDAELKRRGELFRHAGVQDIGAFKRSGATEAIPRSLLLIDEFQEFFTEDDAVAQEASLLLDRIVRQGRAFGIHVILGSQTLGGAYTLARATLGQMVIRIALQCNETDAHLIMDDDNPAPRLLTRPGEGIYNDQAGAVAANSPFQIVWLPEDERDEILDQIAQRAAAATISLPPPPIVFEGNAPAEIRDNSELAAVLAQRPSARPAATRAWLGAPNSIKGPTAAVFQRQSGSHLLVVGQSGERSVTLLAISLAALAAQYPPGAAEFVIIDPHGAERDGDSPLMRLASRVSQRVRVGGPSELSSLMTELAQDLASRTADGGRGAPEVFVMIHDLQRFKGLRPEDDFRFSMDDDGAAPANPSKVLADLLGEGGPVGMHVVATTDTWNNVSRWIPRKLMAEFEMRVLFQMSANDSANLIDSPAASVLGLHRALFFNEHQGTLETFRPYAMPDSDWIAAVGPENPRPDLKLA